MSSLFIYVYDLRQSNRKGKPIQTDRQTYEQSSYDNIWQTTTEEIQYQSSTEQIHRQAQNARS